MQHDVRLCADARASFDACLSAQDALSLDGEDGVGGHAFDKRQDRQSAGDGAASAGDPSLPTETAPPKVSPPRQLWLDVERPIVTRPRRARPLPTPATADPLAVQMELVMVPPVAAGPAHRRRERSIASPLPPQSDHKGSMPAADEPCIPVFGAWLVEQAKRSGMVGELARAVRLDRAFPKSGTVDAIRARFAAIGAEGDAFEALDDAEREYACL